MAIVKDVKAFLLGKPLETNQVANHQSQTLTITPIGIISSQSHIKSLPPSTKKLYPEVAVPIALLLAILVYVYCFTKHKRKIRRRSPSIVSEGQADINDEKRNFSWIPWVR